MTDPTPKRRGPVLQEMGEAAPRPPQDAAPDDAGARGFDPDTATNGAVNGAPTGDRRER